MWCVTIYIRTGHSRYRYCWEITRTNNVQYTEQYTEQFRSWGNFTELQSLRSNNSNGIVQRCLIKGIEQLFAALANSNVLGYDERIEPFIEHLALNISCVSYVYTSIGKIYLTVCLPLYRAFIIITFFWKDDSVSLSIRNIIFFKAFVEGFYTNAGDFDPFERDRPRGSIK